MEYGKIENGELVSAPFSIFVDGGWILGNETSKPSTKQYAIAGYKVVERGELPPIGEGETITTTYTDGDVITCNYLVNVDQRTTQQKRANYYNSNPLRAGWLASYANYDATGQLEKKAAISALIASDNAICEKLYPY